MSNTPIYKGLLQGDLDVAGFDLLNFDAGGSGLPSGGTTGQLLQKQSSADGDADWATVSTGSGDGGTDQSHQVTATELLNSVTGTRIPIASLAPNGGNYFDSQTFDPCILVNPTDSTQLIMFFSAMAAPVQTGTQTIGRATASVTDSTVWTVSGSPVLSASLAWETGGDGLRADSVVYNPSDGLIYLFYTAKTGTTGVGVASSSDLGLTWTKLGQAITPSGAETNLSQMSVLMEGTTLHGIYAYRTAGATLPGYRYASASTSDWLTWTKGGADVYSDPDTTHAYHEFHHLFKVGSTYVLVYESGSPSVDWDIRFATSTSPVSGWTVSPVTPFFVKSEVVGTFDRYMPATPHVRVINGYWYMFYCGAMDHAAPYGTNHFQMGVTQLLTPVYGSQLLIGPDLRLVSITGGGKLQARNPATDTWADVDQWTNP